MSYQAVRREGEKLRVSKAPTSDPSPFGLQLLPIGPAAIARSFNQAPRCFVCFPKTQPNVNQKDPLLCLILGQTESPCTGTAH